MSFDPHVVGGGFGRVSCGIHRNRFRYSGDCYFSARENWSRRWSLTGPAGSAAASAGPQRRCFSDVPARVLRNGQTVRVGPFRCTYRTPAVTCVNARSGHGFSISNKTQRTF